MKKLSIFVFSVLFSLTVSAQTGGVAVSNSGATPDQSAMLDISSGNKGLLIPRLQLTDINDATSILNPANSLLVFNLGSGGVPPNQVLEGFYYWNASLNQWVRLVSGTSAGSDDQQIDSLVLSGTTLTVYVEDGGSASVDLSSLSDADSDPTNEHNTGGNLSGTDFNIIDDGGTLTVDMNPLLDIAKNREEWIDGDTIGTAAGLTYARQALANGDTVVVTDNGRIGIGVSNPQHQLHVLGGTGQFGATNGQLAYIGADGSNVAYAGSWTNHPFQLRINNSTKVHITTNDRVGIGTTNPKAHLNLVNNLDNKLFRLESMTEISGVQYQLYGPANSSSYLSQYFDFGNPSGLDVMRISPTVIPGTGARLHYTHFSNSDTASTGGYNMHYVSIDGRVGIGTTTPLSPLSIENSFPSLRLTESGGAINERDWLLSAIGAELYISGRNAANTSGGNYFSFDRVGHNVNSFYGSRSGIKWFEVNNQIQRVGIGTTNPSRMLHLAAQGVGVQKLKIEETSVGGESMSLGNGTFASTVAFSNTGDFWIGGSTNVDVNLQSAEANLAIRGGTGFVGVGTSLPTQQLTVSNGATIGTYTTAGWVHTSDKRLKANVAPLENSLDKVIQIKGVNFDWGSSPEEQRQIGFLAQDLQKILPEAVVVDSQGNYGVAYGNLSPLLVEAIKEQQKIIEAQQSTISKLSEAISTKADKSEVAFLKSQIEELKSILEEDRKN